MNPKTSAFSFGHVSLELLKYEYKNKTRRVDYIPGCYSKNTYISFGPEGYPPRTKNILEKLRSKTIENYRADLEYEERSPDLTFCFHSLHVNSMVARIDAIRSNSYKRYGLLGAITFGDEADSRLKRTMSWVIRIFAIVVNKWSLLIPILQGLRFRSEQIL